MKIAFATSTAFHLRHLARELLALGHQVEFHSYLPKSKTRSYGLPDSACVSHFWRLLPWSALALIRGGGKARSRIREGLFARVDRAIARQLGDADVLIGLSAVAVESARVASAKGQLVVIERGLTHIITQQAVAEASGGSAPSALYVERELASYACADVVVVLSRHAADSFLAQGFPAERLETVPLGVDTTLFHPAPAPPPLPVRAIFVGGWSRRKGCDLFEPLLNAIPELQLVHVGLQDGLDFPQNPRFTSLGYRTPGQLAEELRQHHLFLFPSRDDGFGMVLAEALASGLRVVSSTASGGPDLARIVGQEHLALIAPGSLEELVAATRAQIAAIQADPARMALESQTINLLSWRGYGTRYAAMLERLLAARA